MGDLNPLEGTYTFIRDHVATVNATPGNGFDHWEGDLEEEDDPNNPMQVVELTESKSLTAQGTDPRPFSVVCGMAS